MISFIFALLSVAQAGVSTEWKEVGNGGKIVICDSTVQTLDVFEAQALYYWHLLPASLIAADNFSRLSIYADVDVSLQMARRFLMRLKKRDPDLWYAYSEILKRFKQEAQLLDDRILADVPDEGLTALPAGCELRQLVVQRVTALRGKRYVINRKLWQKLPYDQQAAMILHEVVYFEALQRRKNLMDSHSVRRMTGLILSQELETLPQIAYLILKRTL